MVNPVFDVVFTRQNCVLVQKEKALEITQCVVTNVLEAIRYAGYVDYAGSIKIGIDEDTDITPFYETEFTRITNYPVNEFDLDSIPEDDIMTIKFNVLEVDLNGLTRAYSGMVQVGLYFVHPQGDVDWAMSRVTYRTISKKLKDAFKNKMNCIYGFETNYEPS